jgi:hypothetical protein
LKKDDVLKMDDKKSDLHYDQERYSESPPKITRSNTIDFDAEEINEFGK